jgi:hypothetical protein
METTRELWKVGGLAVAETKPATKSSNVCTVPPVTLAAQYSRDMSQAKITLQMVPHVAYIPPHIKCSLQSLYPTNSTPSSQMFPKALFTPKCTIQEHHANRFSQWAKNDPQRKPNVAPTSIESSNGMEKNVSKRRKTSTYENLSTSPQYSIKSSL